MGGIGTGRALRVCAATLIVSGAVTSAIALNSHDKPTAVLGSSIVLLGLATAGNALFRHLAGGLLVPPGDLPQPSRTTKPRRTSPH